MKKIPNKILIQLFCIIFISACHTLEHKGFDSKPMNILITNKKTNHNKVNNNKNNLLPKKENISVPKNEKGKKILRKTSVMATIKKSKETKKNVFIPESILNLSEKQLVKKMGRSDFVKNEGILKNHQYYFSNCFVDVFLIKKESGYFVDFFQKRPIKLNGFLNEVNCYKDISIKIKSLKE